MKVLKLLITPIISISSIYSASAQDFTPFKTEKTLSDYNGLEFLDEFSITPVQINGVLNDDPSAKAKLSSMYKGKWIILDISATWYGYCKVDQIYFSAHKNKLDENYSTQDKLWSQDIVQVHLNIEDNSDGGRKQTFDLVRFALTDIRVKHDQALSIADRTGIDSYFVNTKNSREFLKAVDASGSPLFPDFSGYPYQIVINPEGEIIFSNNFTATENEGDEWWAPYVNHYTYISEQIDLFNNDYKN